MIDFLLKFDTFSVPLKLRIFDEFKKAPNHDALRTRLLHHVVNDNTWHLPKNQSWSSDIDHDNPYWTKKDTIKGISVSKAVIDANPILLRTFRHPNEKYGSHFLNNQLGDPTIPI
jgi:hypothetical protein